MPEFDPPAECFYTETVIPPHVRPEAFIGHEGHHLKHITDISQTDYIWYYFPGEGRGQRPEPGHIGIWSRREEKLAKAVRMLQRRAASFKVKTLVHEEKGLKVFTWVENGLDYFSLHGKERKTVDYFTRELLKHGPATVLEKGGNIMIIVKA